MTTVTTMTREEKIARAQEMREEGATYLEIAKAEGCSPAAIGNLFCQAQKEGFEVPPSPYFRRNK